MSIKLGSTDINKIYQGNTIVDRIYRGSNLVYQNSNNTTLTINLIDNQTDTTSVISTYVTLSGSVNEKIYYNKKPIVVEVPINEEVTITPDQTSKYRILPKTITPTKYVETVDILCETELITIKTLSPK